MIDMDVESNVRLRGWDIPSHIITPYNDISYPICNPVEESNDKVTCDKDKDPVINMICNNRGPSIPNKKRWEEDGAGMEGCGGVGSITGARMDRVHGGGCVDHVICCGMIDSDDIPPPKSISTIPSFSLSSILVSIVIFNFELILSNDLACKNNV